MQTFSNRRSQNNKPFDTATASNGSENSLGNGGEEDRPLFLVTIGAQTLATFVLIHLKTSLLL